ncbi:YadA-like family protein [Edwardsiella ictaluri]|uniref:YadA-like family protein n=1 Tax=Edwardsiella ictaluri TaxID=67780 RepID=UPI001E32F3AB|nr:YadA-like family protein [Edwardsiella ictaluri]
MGSGSGRGRGRGREGHRDGGHGGYKDEQAAAVGCRVNETFATKGSNAFGSGSAAYHIGVSPEF